MRPCLEQRCPNLTHKTRCPECERAHQRARNAKPERAVLYTAEWQRHSRQRRAETPYCIRADATCRGVLTVDHPSDQVLCVSHHVRLEAQRRRGGPRFAA